MRKSGEMGFRSEDSSATARDKSNSVFKDRDLLDTNRVVSDDRIHGRDEQISTLITLFKPLIQGSTPSNVLAYGSSGTGKSLIVNRLLNEYQDALAEQGEDLAIVQINCQWLQSNFQAYEKMAKRVSRLEKVDEEVSVSGLSTHEALTNTVDTVDEHYDALVVIIDEIDLLVNPRKSDDGEPAFSSLLYQLTRLNDLVGFGDVSVVALTNQPDFMRDLHSRTETSFNPRDVYFSDYEANQLREILYNREDAFLNGVLDEDVIPLVADITAQDHGGARRAIDLLRTAGDIAVNEGSPEVLEEHVYQSKVEVAKARIQDLAEGYSSSKKVVLFSIAVTQAWSKQDIEVIPSSVVKEVYEFICGLIDEDPKSRRSILRYTSEFEISDLLDSDRVSIGQKSGISKSFTLKGQPKHFVDGLVDQESQLEDAIEEKDRVVDQINRAFAEFSA